MLTGHPGWRPGPPPDPHQHINKRTPSGDWTSRGQQDTATGAVMGTRPHHSHTQTPWRRCVPVTHPPRTSMAHRTRLWPHGVSSARCRAGGKGVSPGLTAPPLASHFKADPTGLGSLQKQDVGTERQMCRWEKVASAGVGGVMLRREGGGHQPRAPWSPQKLEEAGRTLPWSLWRDRSPGTP